MTTLPIISIIWKRFLTNTRYSIPPDPFQCNRRYLCGVDTGSRSQVKAFCRVWFLCKKLPLPPCFAATLAHYSSDAMINSKFYSPAHTGVRKIKNTDGQTLLAKRMGGDTYFLSLIILLKKFTLANIIKTVKKLLRRNQ